VLKEMITAAVVGLLIFVGGSVDAKELKIHVISGSKEYKSQESLTEFIKYLEKEHDIVCTASWASDGASELDDLESLKSSDLLIMFARRMKLVDNQMQLIRDHWEAGKPIVGIRTAGHAFQSDDNEHFDRKVLGGHYSGHYGNEPVKVTNAANTVNHPVLKGVGPYTSAKLYKCGDLPKSTTVLQIGDIGKAKHPITIVNEYKGGRMFFTAAGVPSDFENKDFRHMLVNAIYWTTEN
jgi:type 1 glutamine amidotransferase